VDFHISKPAGIIKLISFFSMKGTARKARRQKGSGRAFVEGSALVPYGKRPELLNILLMG
jgi:hypothetical protein